MGKNPITFFYAILAAIVVTFYLVMPITDAEAHLNTWKVPLCLFCIYTLMAMVIVFCFMCLFPPDKLYHWRWLNFFKGQKNEK